MYREEPLIFHCQGETLVGVLALPAAGRNERARTGVLVVVGGPQYRAGSHRQFVSLARFLAARGCPCLRFDFRGMGDSTGASRGFEAVDDDIAAAAEAFVTRVPGLERVVLWGLCDGASAACFRAPRDPRVAGVILVNPWVRTEQGEAQTYLRYYYTKRLTDPRFWNKLLHGRVSILSSLWGLLRAADKARGAKGREAPEAGGETLPGRMAASLARCSVPFAVMLSGRDYVAGEFVETTRGDGPWRRLLQGPRAQSLRFESADHTFSGPEQGEALALATWRWLVDRGFAEVAMDRSGSGGAQ